MNRSYSLDALRGVFAILVMVYHCSYWLKLPFAEWLHSGLRFWGVYAVEGFFIISGFALFLSTRKLDFSKLEDVRVFFVRRYSRILPLYALLFYVYFGELRVSERYVVEIAMLFGFYDPSKSTLTGGWSIGVEFVFYFLFPLFSLLLRDRVNYTMLAVSASMLIMVLISTLFNPFGSIGNQNYLYVNPVNHLFFFLSGYLLGIVYSRGGSPAQGGLVWLPVLAFMLILSALGYNDGQAELMGSDRRLLLSVLLVMCVYAVSLISTSHFVVIILGELSYAIYLIHPFIVFKILPRVSIENVWLEFTLVITLSTILAVMSYRLFEMPAQRIIRKLLHA